MKTAMITPCQGPGVLARSRPAPAINPTITSVVIGPMPKRFGDPMPTVTASFTDGTSRVLFDFYPDELSFTKEEFVGLTLEQAGLLKTRKDIAYLQS